MADDFVDDFTEEERPVLTGPFGGTLAADDAGFVRLTSPVTGAGLFNTNMDPNTTGLDPLTGIASPVGTDLAFGAPMRRYLETKVLNGGYDEPPPDTSMPINDSNPLPGWRWVDESGAAFEGYWQSSGAAGNGQVVMAMKAGAAGDRSYLEQLVPVNPSVGTTWTYDVLPYITGAATADAYVHAQFLTAALVTTGTPGIIANVTASGTLLPNGDGDAPSDARYLRLRLGFQRNGSAATADTASGLVIVDTAVRGETGTVGTFTPAITFATPGDLTVVYSTATGRWKRVGKLVFWWINIVTTTFTWTTTSGNLQITGLPFTAATGLFHLGVGNISYTKANYKQVAPGVSSATTLIRWSAVDTSGGLVLLTAAEMPSGTNVVCYAAGMYEAAP